MDQVDLRSAFEGRGERGGLITYDKTVMKKDGDDDAGGHDDDTKQTSGLNLLL
jgi:hypothetical protein